MGTLMLMNEARKNPQNIDGKNVTGISATAEIWKLIEQNISYLVQDGTE